jgi:hypothetical protein
MKIRRYIGFALVVIGWLVCSCNRPSAPDCFQKAGDVVVENRDVLIDYAIRSVEVNDEVELRFTYSEESSIVVEGPVNLLPEIITDLDADGHLVIDDLNSCDFVRKLNLRIIVTVSGPIEEIINYGLADVSTSAPFTGSSLFFENYQASGDIRLELACDQLTYKTHTGVSSTTLLGSCAQALLFSNGLGPFRADELACGSVNLNSGSINDVWIQSNGYTYIAINQSGNVYLSGNPGLIELVSNGTGELIID